MRRTGVLTVVVLVVAALVATAGAAVAAPPNGTFTAPTANQVLPVGTVTLQGNATDDVGVSRAQVAVRNTSTGLWRQANGTWASRFVWLSATLASPGATSSTWSFAFQATSGSYSAGLRVTDTEGAPDATTPWVAFRVSSADAAPNTTITNPSPNQVVAPGTVTMAGTATDDRGVASVQVAVRDAAGRWLRTDGTWSTTTTWLTGAVLTAPGATSSGWSRQVDLVAGSYSAGARARDTASRYDASPAWVAFSVQETQPTSRPNVVLVLTDDQRFDTLDAMPATTRLIGDPGVRFRNAFVVNPLCCPSRATLPRAPTRTPPAST